MDVFDFLEWAKSKNISWLYVQTNKKILAIDLLKKLDMYKYFEFTV